MLLSFTTSNTQLSLFSITLCELLEQWKIDFRKAHFSLSNEFLVIWFVCSIDDRRPISLNTGHGRYI